MIKKKLKTLKVLVALIALLFFVAFADGFFAIGFSDGFYEIIGLLDIVFIVWSLIIVFGNDFNDFIKKQ